MRTKVAWLLVAAIVGVILASPATAGHSKAGSTIIAK
jgi:hypothetical protein